MIYVEEMASLVKMSTGYFKAWFKKETGRPPQEYTNLQKIEKAKIELQTTKSVTKVAFSLGFGSCQYFATTFKKFTGATPKSYRRLQRA